MEKTGMTRRIDELGRLVIPKEIRKNLKIKDNDQVEISVIDNKIILSKYNSLNKDQTISILINNLRKVINKDIIFTSRDHIIDYSIHEKGSIDTLLLNEDIMNIIENRKNVINEINKGIIYSVFPLIINGDLYGSIIINGNKDLNNCDLMIINFCLMFLENYLE